MSTLLNQWVPLDTIYFKESGTITGFIESNLGPDGKIYIFRNPKELRDYGEHYGRLKFSEELSDKSYHKLRKKGYDLVFLYIKDNPSLHKIIKLKQKDDEQKICYNMGTCGAGPVFNDVLTSPFNNYTEYIVEDFLSQADGWNPIYLQFPTIKKHYNLFIDDFAILMADIHNSDVVYNDKFDKHVFFNSLKHECMLVDFGNSYTSDNPKDMYDEILRVHDFLSKLFPKKKEEVTSRFNKKYDFNLL
ncbi:MAG: hypothetical protein K0B07_02650 [DPANN group archaeon]|nr:hypothetical protein [DPANN group archaeon]